MKRKPLTVLGKSLMPEILPDPSAQRVPGGPRDRVRTRLRQLKEHATAVAAAASLAACGAETHSADAGSANAGAGGTGASGTGAAGTSTATGGRGMNVTGGKGASGSGGVSGMNGTGGYAVVDPVPEPYVCPKPPESAIGSPQVRWNGDAIDIQLQTYTYRALSLDSIGTPAGIIGNVTTLDPIAARLTRSAPVPWPKSIDVYLRFTCKDRFGVVSFDVGLRLDTSTTGTGGLVPYTEIRDADAGR